MKARVKQADQCAAFYEATRLAGFDIDEALAFLRSASARAPRQT